MKVALGDFIGGVELAGCAVTPAAVAVLVRAVHEMEAVIHDLSIIVEAQKEMLDRLVGPNKHIYAKLEDVGNRLDRILQVEVPNEH